MILLIILLFIILFLISFTLVIVLLLIFSPIKGQVWCSENSLKVRGKYLFGTLKVEYVPGNTNIYLLGFHLNKKSKSKSNHEDTDKEKEKKSSSKKKKKPKKEKKKKGIPSKEVIFLSLKLIKKLIRKIAPKTIQLNVKLGLDDPYDTGMVCLINQTLMFPLNRVDDYDIKLNPVYNDLTLKVDGYGKINFSIASLLLPILFWVIKKPIRNYLGWGFKFKK